MKNLISDKENLAAILEVAFEVLKEMVRRQEPIGQVG
jgi:hypothetical protein